jgi:glucokinase
LYLGIEIGGTKLLLGVGPGDGTLAGLWRETVDVAAGAEGIRQQIATALPDLLTHAGIERRQVRGAGIGFGGPVDDRTRTVIRSYQIQGWDGFALADWIGEITGLPTVLGNDADVAGLAEALFGAGKGLSPIFYITIGSGIGGGLIIDGIIYRGCGRGAAEIGHLLAAPPRLTSPCELEQVASGWGIGVSAREKIRQGHGLDSEILRLVGGQVDQVTARQVGEAAALGDRFAQSVLREAHCFLAQALCNVIALLCPRRIIIGGGVSMMGEELLFQPLRQLVAEYVLEPFAGLYDIVPAALGEEVVVHGALAQVRQRLGG